jgi:hypothetical protein
MPANGSVLAGEVSDGVRCAGTKPSLVAFWPTAAFSKLFLRETLYGREAAICCIPQGKSFASQKQPLTF